MRNRSGESGDDGVDLNSGEIIYNPEPKEAVERSINPSTDSDSDTLSGWGTPNLIEPLLANKDHMELPGLEIFPSDDSFISQPAVTEKIKLNPETTAPDIITGDGGLIESPLETRILPVNYGTPEHAPLPKRKKDRKALPEPREPRVCREAFESALGQLAKTLKRTKELNK